MGAHGERIGRGTVRFQRDLPGPIERVWRYLTESDARSRWFCAGDTELRIGGGVELHFHHADLSPLPDDPPPPRYADMPDRMSFRGEVTQCDPPYRLAYTWIEGEQSTEVCFELEALGDRVRLTLTHSRLATREEERGVLGGWHAHLDILGDVLEGRTPTPFWRRYVPIDRDYAARLPG